LKNFRIFYEKEFKSRTLSVGDKALLSIKNLNFEFYYKATVSHKSMRCGIIFASRLSGLQAFWPFAFNLSPLSFSLLPDT
jgi:hypothetical protein